MFNPIRAVLDGYYPSQRDQDGAFAWMNDENNGAIFPSSRDEFSAGEFHSDEGKQVGPFTPVNAPFVFSSDTGSWGGGPNIPNIPDTGANTAYGVLLSRPNHDTMFRGNLIESWTWAGVLKHFFFPNSLWNQQVFLMLRFYTFFTYVFISFHINSVYGFRVSLNHAAFQLFAPPNNDASNDPGRGTRYVVTYEAADEELRIYQDGVLAASGIFAQLPPVVDNFTQFLWGGSGKGLDSFSGFFGASSFQSRCWTPHQVAAWSADPWGQYRPNPTLSTAVAAGQIQRRWPRISQLHNLGR